MNERKTKGDVLFGKDIREKERRKVRNNGCSGCEISKYL